MLDKVKTATFWGLEDHPVDVEVDISSDLPAVTIVGLPDAAVQEARERMRAAIRNSGFTFPMRRIVVNLAPADLKKAGPAYDLPIAVEEARQVQTERFNGSEQSLNAEMTPTAVRRFCATDDSAQALLKAAITKHYLSARAFPRILKMARTIADLDKSDIIRAHHLAESIQYRPRWVV